MRLSLIVALDRNGLIGQGNRLPWHLPADLRHFKEITMGKPVIMGRRTAESIGRPLPGRRNLLLTRNPDWRKDGFEVFTDVESLIRSVQHVDECMVIGGSEIYGLFWPRADRAYVTLVEGIFTGDTWFPEWPLSASWQMVSSRERPPDEKNPHPLRFMMFEKVEKV